MEYNFTLLHIALLPIGYILANRFRQNFDYILGILNYLIIFLYMIDLRLYSLEICVQDSNTCLGLSYNIFLRILLIE